MADAGEVKVKITAEDATKNAVQSATQSLKSFAAKAVSILALTSLARSSLQAFKEEETQNIKLNELLKTRLGLNKQEIENIKKLTSEYQKVGVIGDEVQKALIGSLSATIKNKDALTGILPTMLDILAAQKGVNASISDAETLAQAFNRALSTGSLESLQRSGVFLTEEQKETFKELTTDLEKVNFLVPILNNQFKGFNAELAKTEIGKFQQLNNTFGDMKEQLGKALLPTLNDLFSIFLNILDSVGGLNNAIALLLVTFGTFKVARLVSEIAKAIAAFSALAVAKTAAQTGVGAIAAVPAVIAALGAGIAAVGAFTAAGIISSGGQSTPSAEITKQQEIKITNNIQVDKDELGFDVSGVQSARNGASFSNVVNK